MSDPPSAAALTIRTEGLSVVAFVQGRADPSGQDLLVEAMTELVGALAGQRGYLGAALHKGRTGQREALDAEGRASEDAGRHVALYSLRASREDLSSAAASEVRGPLRSASSLAPEFGELAESPHEFSHEVVLADRAQDGRAGRISVGDAAPFVNMFRVPDGRQRGLAERFRQTVPAVSSHK